MVNVELVMPPADLRDWRTKAKDKEFFDRGERIIMVEGERWGRTHVSWHGSRGTSTTFHQDGWGTLTRTSKRGDREYNISVSSASKRHARRFIPNGNGGTDYRLPGGFKDTNQLVLEKINEMIAEGKLRHPSIVKQEVAAENAAYARRREAAAAKEEAEFRTKAAEAVRANDPNSEIVDRVVEVMRWAQGR